MRRGEHPEDRELGISEMLREVLGDRPEIRSVRAPKGKGHWRTEIALADGSRYRVEVEETHPPEESR